MNRSWMRDIPKLGEKCEHDQGYVIVERMANEDGRTEGHCNMCGEHVECVYGSGEWESCA